MASGEIKLFHNDDSAYSRWVERYGGYVLTAKTRGGGFSLHTVDCYHLGPYKDGSRTTRKPRRWASYTPWPSRRAAQRAGRLCRAAERSACQDTGHGGTGRGRP